eukprot:3416417-Rhodomonas_salina.2
MSPWIRPSAGAAPMEQRNLNARDAYWVRRSNLSAQIEMSKAIERQTFKQLPACNGDVCAGCEPRFLRRQDSRH